MGDPGAESGRDSIVRASGLCRSFGAIRALEDVSLDVRRGEVLLLLGHNGAGKTTFLKILLGLLKPTRGDIRAFGLCPCDHDEGLRARSRMGVMLESNGLYEKLSAWENLEIFARIAHLDSGAWKPRAETLLGRLGLTDRSSEPVRKWSAGMKRKLCFLRAVLARPELLLLDEPTAGLDSVTRHTIRGVLSDMVREDAVTAVIATQDLGEAEHNATHVAFLRLGGLVYSGGIGALHERLRIRKLWLARHVAASDVAGRLSGSQVAAEELTWAGRTAVLRWNDSNTPPPGAPLPLPAGATEIPVTLEDLYLELARDMGDI